MPSSPGQVADFGLSQKRRSEGIAGTPFWMAPELLLGLPSSPASDVYAFGVTLFEVFTRKEPYAGEDMEEVLLQVR